MTQLLAGKKGIIFGVSNKRGIAYAIAKACKQAEVNFKCFKYVSDQADENASKDWQETVADGEQHYINAYLDVNNA